MKKCIDQMKVSGSQNAWAEF